MGLLSKPDYPSWYLIVMTEPLPFEPILSYVQCPDAQGGHRMAYWDWGNPAHTHVVICVHGISRQGRDFDTLARALIGPDGQRCRVISVDIAGRGYSDWLKDPLMYAVPSYAADMGALLATLRANGSVKTIDWVGTSMGGLIGIALAPQPSVGLRKLILNDVGPVVQWSALQRISSYIGADPRFESEQEAADAMWKISTSFGPHTPAQWLALSKPMLRPVTDGSGGKFKLHYDPAIAVAVKATTPELAAQGEAMLWKLYDVITCDTLLIRGAESDLISPATAQAMQARGPKAKLVEFAGVGHAPTLIAVDQVHAVTSFLFE
jgi:pimeloyl-ACP methyl ester carboxylesterase